MTKLGFVEQLTELPEFPSGSVEQKMCKKIAELTQVSLKTCSGLPSLSGLLVGSLNLGHLYLDWNYIEIIRS